MKRALPRPTNSELDILSVLWSHGPGTVSDIQERMGPGKRSGYTTILKLLQIMLDKGLVGRNEASRPHVYDASLSEKAIQRDLVADLLQKAFAGSRPRLLQQLLGSRKVSRQELEEIRELLQTVNPGKK